jgi:hypothetical protein
LEPENLVNWKNRYIVKLGNKLYEVKDNQTEIFNWQPTDILKIGSTENYLYAIHRDGGFSYFDGENEKKITLEQGLYNFSIDRIHATDNYFICVSTKEIRYIPIETTDIIVRPKLKERNISGTYTFLENKWTSAYESNNIKLSWELLPNIRANGKGKIWYRIPGLYDDWKTAEEDDWGYFVEFERLPYGNYVLEVFGENEKQQPSDINIYTLVVYPPFYLTIWFLFISLVLFAAILFITWKWRIGIINKKNLEKIEKERLKIKALNAELTAIRSQMNPHFIFNSLSSIQTKILSNESKEAYTHLNAFSKLLRQALEFSQKEYIKLSEEISFLSNYIELEQLRKDKHFSFNMHIDSAINTENVLFPSLLLQPFVENAIIHGLNHANGEKQLHVLIQKTTEGYSVNIEDNGIGRKASADINQNRSPDHKSFATKAILERIEIINQGNKMKISVQIFDLKKGTRVEIKVRLIK